MKVIKKNLTNSIHFSGNMNIVLNLLNNGAAVDQRTMRGETPLHLAARANQTDVMRILLRNKAEVDAKARVSAAGEV